MHKVFIITFSLIYFLALRWHATDDNLFFDYDAVKNFLVAQEIAVGNFLNLFHHGAPLMHLFHGIGFLLIQDKILYLPALIESIGVVFISYTILRVFNITNTIFILLCISITGTSFLLVNGGRFFSLEPYTVFCFYFWLTYYLKSKDDNNKKHFWIIGLLILINYKMCMILPFYFVNDLLYKKAKFNINYLSAYLIPAWILPFTIVLACFTNQHILSYPIKIVAMLFLRDEPSLDLNMLFSFSIGFYLKYLVYFEHPIVLIGLLVSIINVFIIVKKRSPESKIDTIYLFTSFLFISMSLFPPAPRGIIIIIPLLCITGCYYIYIIVDYRKHYEYALFIGLLISLLYPLHILHKNTYSRSQSGYREIANFIENENIKTFYTTSGIGIQPFLKSEITKSKVIVKEEDYAKIPKGSYILVDAEALLNGWTKLPQGTSLKSNYNSCKTQPMLALENAEHSGYTFEQAMHISEKLTLLKNKQLYIIKKGD